PDDPWPPRAPAAVARRMWSGGKRHSCSSSLGLARAGRVPTHRPPRSTWGGNPLPPTGGRPHVTPPLSAREHLRLVCRADVPQGGCQEQRVVEALVLTPPADQLGIGEEEAWTIILAELLDGTVEEAGGGLLLAVPPGPKAATMRLPAVVDHGTRGQAIEL